MECMHGVERTRTSPLRREMDDQSLQRWHSRVSPCLGSKKQKEQKANKRTNEELNISPTKNKHYDSIIPCHVSGSVAKCDVGRSRAMRAFPTMTPVDRRALRTRAIRRGRFLRIRRRGPARLSRLLETWRRRCARCASTSSVYVGAYTSSLDLPGHAFCCCHGKLLDGRVELYASQTYQL